MGLNFASASASQPLAVICVVSAILTFGAASGTVRLVLWLQNRKGDEHHES